MKRGTLNFIVDLISFCDLLALAFTGSIMKWVLPPGNARTRRPRRLSTLLRKLPLPKGLPAAIFGCFFAAPSWPGPLAQALSGACLPP
jgi:hypothetical protein